MSSREMAEAVIPVIRALGQLGVRYYFGGSVASSTLGIARATNDADIVAEFRIEHSTPFVRLLAADFYVREPTTLGAGPANSRSMTCCGDRSQTRDCHHWTSPNRSERRWPLQETSVKFQPTSWVLS